MLVAAFSEACCSGTNPSVPLSTTPTPDQFYWPVKPTEHSRIFRFGMTCVPLMASHGEELLTWFLAGFPAKTSALPETAQDLTANDPDSGEKWRGSLAKYDPVSRTLKTAQLSLLEDLTGCLPTLPRSGWMRDGECFQLPVLAPPICESASGYWQTPVADDAVNRVAGKWNSRGEPKLSAQVMYPTPLANSHTGAGHGPNKTGAPNLQTVVAQVAAMSLTMKNLDATGAQTAKAKTYPTATATAYKGWSPNHNRADTDDRLDYTIEREAFQPGQQTPPMRLNPDWVEWLMGWPIGHTALKPLATGRYQEFVRQHGDCLEGQ